MDYSNGESNEGSFTISRKQRMKSQHRILLWLLGFNGAIILAGLGFDLLGWGVMAGVFGALALFFIVTTVIIWAFLVMFGRISR